MVKRILDAVAIFGMFLGMSCLDSEGTGYTFAVLLTTVSLLFLFCWGSKGRQ